MTKFDDIIYEIASGNFGLITSAEAREAGLTNNELVQYARRGRVERVGHGVYRLVQRVPEPNDDYALAVALVGPGAYLYGEAVLGMLGLCPTNPAYVHVATPRRPRRALPDRVRAVHVPGGTAISVYDGIPCQHVADAIRAASAHMLPERLADAADRAREEGYLTRKEHAEILEELGAIR